MSDIIPPDPSKKVGLLGAELQAHEGRKDNPHEVTAHEAGAYTQEEIDDQLSALASEIHAAQNQITAHEENISNPHNVTAAQAGAVPVAQGVAFTYDNATTNPYSFQAGWKNNDVLLTLGSGGTAPTTPKIAFTDSNIGDGEGVNFIVQDNPDNISVEITAGGTLSFPTLQTKHKFTSGAVSVVRYGTKLQIIGKLSA